MPRFGSSLPSYAILKPISMPSFLCSDARMTTLS
jgi:hypothetical protein